MIIDNNRVGLQLGGLCFGGSSSCPLGSCLGPVTGPHITAGVYAELKSLASWMRSKGKKKERLVVTQQPLQRHAPRDPRSPTRLHSIKVLPPPHNPPGDQAFNTCTLQVTSKMTVNLTWSTYNLGDKTLDMSRGFLDWVGWDVNTHPEYGNHHPSHGQNRKKKILCSSILISLLPVDLMWPAALCSCFKPSQP